MILNTQSHNGTTYVIDPRDGIKRILSPELYIELANELEGSLISEAEAKRIIKDSNNFKLKVIEALGEQLLNKNIEFATESISKIFKDYGSDISFNPKYPRFVEVVLPENKLNIIERRIKKHFGTHTKIFTNIVSAEVKKTTHIFTTTEDAIWQLLATPHYIRYEIYI